MYMNIIKCSYYSRVATIQGVATIWINTVFNHCDFIRGDQQVILWRYDDLVPRVCPNTAWHAGQICHSRMGSSYWNQEWCFWKLFSSQDNSHPLPYLTINFCCMKIMWWNNMCMHVMKWRSHTQFRQSNTQNTGIVLSLRMIYHHLLDRRGVNTFVPPVIQMYARMSEEDC